MTARSFPWRTLLFVSVAVNILGVGAALGAYASGARLERTSPASLRVPTVLGPAQPKQAEPPPAPPPLQENAIINALPSEARAQVRSDLSAAFLAARPLRIEAYEARLAVEAAAQSDPMNRGALAAALGRMRTADMAVAAAYHAAVIDALAQLTPAQRRAAVNAMLRTAARRAAARAPAQATHAVEGAAVDDAGFVPVPLPPRAALRDQGAPARELTIRERLRRERLRETMEDGAVRPRLRQRIEQEGPYRPGAYRNGPIGDRPRRDGPYR